MSILKRKRGMTTATVVKLLLGLIVLGLLIYWLFFSSQAVAKNLKKDCVADLGGRCSTLYLQCLPGEEVSPVGGICDKEGKQTCCVPIAKTTPDEFCKDKKPGDSCGPAADYKVCNDALQCSITKCEFCDAKPSDPNCNTIFNDANKKIDFGPDFSCVCTLAECNSKLNDGNCVKKFCSGTTYCCVK